MFDFAFSELVIVMLVALVVIGPERLPKVARTAGNLWGRLQRYVQNVKSDIANDIAIEEAKKLRGTIRDEIDAIERATLEARMAIDQKVLDAQTGRSSAATSEQKTSGAQPSATPDKQA
jgi:sec-independent protein translocase protein TatB